MVESDMQYIDFSFAYASMQCHLMNFTEGNSSTQQLEVAYYQISYQISYNIYLDGKMKLLLCNFCETNV